MLKDLTESIHLTHFPFLKLLTILVLLLTAVTVNATTYYSRANGLWSSNITWSLTSGGVAVAAGIYPVAGDVVIIEKNYNVTIHDDSNCASLQVGTATSGKLTFGDNQTTIVTVSGNVAVQSNGTITSGTNGKTAHTFNIAGNISCAGTWDMYGKKSIDDINVVMNGTVQTVTGIGAFGWNSLTVNSGSLTTMNTSFGQNIYSNLTIAGTLDLGTNSLNWLNGKSGNTLTVSGKMILGGNSGGQTGSNFPANFPTINLSGGTVEYNMAGAQTVYNGPAYNNLTLTGSGVKTTTGVSVNGVLSMESTATASALPTYGSLATLQYNTTIARSAGVEWGTPFAASGGVKIANTGVITLNGDKVFSLAVPLNINAGATLNTDMTPSKALTFGGDFNNSGTFTANASAITINNTMSNQSISGFTITGSVTMTKTSGTATLQGNVNAINLTVNGSGGTLHLGAGLTHTFAGLITLTAGTLHGGSSILNENATSAAAWNGNGSLFISGTGTVIFGGGAQTISATGTTTFNNLTFTNTGVKTIAGSVTVNGVLSMEGAATATLTGTLTYGNSSTLQYKGSIAQTTGNEFVTPFNGSGGVKINNANGVTLGSARNLGTKQFTIGDVVSNSLFNDGGYQLTSTGTLNLTSGTYTVKYSNFPAFTITNITSGTTVDYAATGTQTIKGTIYSNLTISGTGTNSKITDGNITVNGILNLSSANYSPTQGCLDMNTTPFILTMGANATTTGTGDVTGIVTRNSFMVNTPYTFGNQYTILNMQSGGSLPATVSVKIVLTAVHTWKSDAIHRYYDFIQTGGTSGTVATLNLHYLTGELNSTTEGNLNVFDYHVSASNIEEHAHSNFSTTNKWVGIANLPINYIAPTSSFGNMYWTLGNSSATNFTWVGGVSTDWTTPINWVGSVVPGPADAVVIPDAATTSYDPTLPPATTIKSITILTGGILNATTGSPILTINGGAGAWENLGTLNAGTSTVIFTNAAATMADPTNFYNVTVANGATLTLGTDNIMRIAGVLTLTGSGILNAASNNNTVEYNGADQTVIFPNGSTSGYYHLILSGSGTKIMPSPALTIYGNLEMGGTASATALNTLNISGNVKLGSGTTFAASTFCHTISGNWTNNGGTFIPDTGTFAFNNTTLQQTINGTAASQTFNNIIVDKSTQLLSIGGITSSLTVNDLTETSGDFTATTNLTVNGNVLLTAGTFTAGTTTNLSGNWTNNGAVLVNGNGTINMNGPIEQIISGTTSNTFNHVTVNNAAGVTATIDQTINGVLNLPLANPSPTKGCFDMGNNFLYMGVTATNTGIGDVTGTITHNHPFAINTNYTFGNPNSRMKFNDVPGGQVFPTTVSVNVTIGNSLAWTDTPLDGVKRQFIVSHIGGSGNAATFRASYLDSELASGTNESTLSFWSFILGANLLTDQGRSNYNITQNYIALTDIDFTGLPSSMYVGIAPTQNTRTWNGSLSTDWNTTGNWTPNGTPTIDQGVIIPDAALTLNDPDLPVGAGCHNVIIQSGGVLNTLTDATLELSGDGAVWSVEPNIGALQAGLFNAGNSTVSISSTITSTTLIGSTDFYNLIIGSGVNLRLNTGSYTGISGVLTMNGILDARSNTNTVEFKGTGQVIPNPNFSIPGFGNLIINSSATGLIWPSVLNIGGTFTNNKSALSITSTVVMDGASPQSITGTQTTTFNSLTINNPYGVNGSNDIILNGVLSLQSNNPSSTTGALDMGSNILNLGVNSSVTGSSDVTGTISRNHLFAENTYYPFSSANHGVTFTGLPSQSGNSLVMKMNNSIGSTTDWSGCTGSGNLLNPTKRVYTVWTSGSWGTTKGYFRAHYQATELADGVNSSLLTIWAKTESTGCTVSELGKSSQDLNNHYVTLGNVPICIFPTTQGVRQITLAPTASSNITWTGTISTDMTNPENWSPILAPSATIGLLIPSRYTTTYSPQLSGTITCKNITLESNALLNSTGTPTLELTGSGLVWTGEQNSTFSSGNSTVSINCSTASSTSNIAGSASFYNLAVQSGSTLIPSAGSYIAIENTLTINGIFNPAIDENTIEFSGTDQTIPDAHFQNLVLSGGGIKTLPTSLHIISGFTNNSIGTVDATTNSSTVVFEGNGNIGGTVKGVTSTEFNNLTVDCAGSDILVETHENVNGTLTITSGSILDMGMNDLGGTMTSITGAGTVKTQSTNSTPLPAGKTWSQSVQFNNVSISQVIPAGNYSAGLTISNPVGVNAAGTIDIGNLTIDNGAILDMGTNLLNTFSSISGTGILKTQNTATTPIPSGKTWPGTVVYNGISAQAAVTGTFHNLTVDNAAGVTLTDSATVNGTLLINTGKSMVINTGAKMTAEQVINNADVNGLLIKSSSSVPNGTLIFNNASINPVPGTVEMYSKASKPDGYSYKWQFFGIPLRSVVASPIFDGSYVREMHENSVPAHWYQLNNASVLNSFTGYEITQLSSKTINYRGVLENRDYNSGKLSFTTNVSFQGQHLIANPYTAAIDISKIVFGSSNAGIIENTVYLYNTGSMADWTAAGSGTAVNSDNESAGQYICVPYLTKGALGLPTQIPSMQAFLVQVKSDNPLATVSIPYSSVGTVVKNTTKQRSLTSKNPCTKIDIKGSRFADRVWIISEPTCTREFNNGWDGYKFIGNALAPQLWAMENDGDYQVDAVNDINNTELGFIHGEDTSYKLTFTHENLSLQYPNLYLIDLLDNTTTDITQSGSTYTFTATQTALPIKRFKIITNNGLTTKISTVENNGLKIFSSGKTVFVQNSSDLKGEILIYDITGKAIQKNTFSANGVTTIPTALTAGSYIVKGITPNQKLTMPIVIN